MRKRKRKKDRGKNGIYLIQKNFKKSQVKCCEKCGSKNELEIHHKKHYSNGGTEDIFNLMVLCKECHKRKHKRYKR